MPSSQRIILVHYHEIGLKGNNRSSFENRLLKNLKFHLADYPIRAIKRISGRLLVTLDAQAGEDMVERIVEATSRIPGVARVSSGLRCEKELASINETAVEVLGSFGEFQSFKVAARRNHTDFEHNSMEINALVGEHLCNAFPDKRVQMKGPDATVHVEVIEGASYVYASSVRGIGGLPVGASGKLVCLLSSGIDSPVATWKMARRGAVCIGVHFSARPEAAATSEYLVDDIAHVLEASGCIARVYVVPFGQYQRRIAAVVPPQLRVILYRRLMFKVAEAIAAKEGAKGLVTGESLGQVASQTIDNIFATNEAVSLPVLRPLVGSDKVDIINMAQELGTFGISSMDATDCCTLFMPRNPETHARLDQVLAAESQLDSSSWIEEIMDALEVHDYACPAYKPSKEQAM